MFLTFYFKFTLKHSNASFTSKWQTIYFKEDSPHPPTPPPKKKSNIKRKKGSFLSPEVPSHRADKQKCLNKNSRRDLLFITNVRWPFQNAIDRFVFNASFFPVLS